MTEADAALPPPAVPVQTEPPLDVHKPKPVHSWREFASEIGVIIIGILIALSGEQAVEWLHWQTEVRESRDAIQAELAYDLGSRKVRDDEIGCINRRLDDLQRWHDSYKAGLTLIPTVPISGPSSRDLVFDAWNIAQAGQVAARMPLEERIKYAALYGNLRSFDEKQVADRQVWNALQAFDGAPTLDHGDLMKLQGIINSLRFQNESFGGNWSGISRRAAAVGVKIGPHVADDPVWRARFCGSLFAPPAQD